MKPSVIGTALLLVLASCGSPKPGVTGEEAVEQQEAGQGFSTGRVTTDHAGDGCPVLVKVDGVNDLFLLPIGLEDRYKRNGLVLRFKYRPSRASIGECRKGEAAILEEITIPPVKGQRALEDK